MAEPEDVGSETLRMYEEFPEVFDQKFACYFENRVKDEAEFYLENLKGRRILDLGSGPGAHAAYFQARGYDVLCGDASSAMLECCRQKGLRTQRVDMENLQFAPGSFDGVWAYASLLHIPRARAPRVLEAIHRILVPSGLFELALKEGTGEGFEPYEHCPGTRRWFTYYTDAEVRELVKEHFDLVRYSLSYLEKKYVFLKYILRARP